MKTIILSIFTLLLFTLSSCVPDARKVRSLSSTDSTSSDDTDDSTTNPVTSETHWYSDSLKVTGFLSQNTNALKSYYLRGAAISDYLIKQNKQAKTFCLVTTFSASTSTKTQLRVRAIPFRILNSSEYALRIEVTNEDDNKLFCGGDSVNTYNSSDDIVSQVNAVNAAYVYSDLCETCSKVFTSLSVKLFESVSGAISNSSIVSSDYINLRSLGLKIDVTNNTTTPISTCSNSSCQAQGLDCCLEGQCVNDGVLKSNPDSTTLAQALLDVSKDFNNFRKWPTVYNVCTTYVPPPTDTTTPTDPSDEAKAKLDALIKDYECLQGDTLMCDPDLLTVQQRTWKECGCMLDPITNDPLDPRCPDYTLEVVKDASDNIIKVQCLIPTNETTTPFKNQSVNIPVRSAPHRYFTSTGTSYDSLSLAPAGSDQEGSEFSYLDEVNKVSPITTSFNMNAILGQMSLALDKTLPAYEIDVEFDKTYIISAKSGYYSPCPTCQRDYWYNVFSSHPEVSTAHGLSYRNYTTKRDAHENNVTNGNYEDTIFGRACWVPPTMIGFSHKPETNSAVQRRNRLETQSAFFVNGYQRDWYGFNKGALIGSFDGVNWFAIGSNRRVQSTTSKLFLAINAPFADLASATNYNVYVKEDIGGETASDMDWDFDLGPSSSLNNNAASCQASHSCETDTDCITNLGWEYACADVNTMKTSWPRFDLDANEKANDKISSISISSLLLGGIGDASSKRCVYRGAGSLCKVNNSTGTSSEQIKQLTCAPNFYCAALNSPSFNKEVKRSANEPTGILYGQGANVLGRAKKYIGANTSLTATIKANILSNISNLPTPTESEYGLCVPGKSTITSSSKEVQHKTKDSANRTDYISQIAGCDSSAIGNNRTLACPQIDTNGNLVRTGALDSASINRQNMCGGESVKSDGVTSTFRDIEKGTLNLATLLISQPSFAKDACFRRAGSVCHTDLDCSPNKLHEEVAKTLSYSDFGGTIAEYKFWNESLVCGQAQIKPVSGIASIDDYNDYNMNQNKCCREISKDFTMYTTLTGAGSSLYPGYDVNNVNLNTATQAFSDPKATGRYSRYTTATATETIAVNTATTTTPITANQWKKINQTGTQNCCGGGFIRKFADGTNNWSVRNRLRLPPENFACLNYKTRSYDEAPTGYPANNWSYDYSYLCLYPKLSSGQSEGCIQLNIPEDAPDLITTTPSTYTNTSRTFTTNPGNGFDGSGTIDLAEMINAGIPYPPTINKSNGYLNPLYIFYNSTHPSAPDFTSDVGAGNSAAMHHVSFYLPTYITTTAQISSIKIRVDGDDMSQRTYQSGVDLNYQASVAACNRTTIGGYAAPTWCLGTDAASARTYLSVYMPAGDYPLAAGASNDWEWGYVEIDFIENYPAGAKTPGSAQYYENRLAKLELLGVPQATYNYLTCNDSTSAATPELIPDLYGTTTIPAANVNDKIQYRTDKTTINHDQIFAANDFMCCSKVGNTVDAPSKCCSGFGVSDGSNYTCKLPQGTNLHLYLNQFISSEGNIEYSDDEKLDEADFDSETGFPKYSEDNYAIIKKFGEEHCSNNKVREGSAFGNFGSQPGAVNSKDFYSIVDSPLDSDDDAAKSYGIFTSGYRWTIHTYCE